MRLTSLTVQHYKSLANVQLENIQPVTVLVGPNAAGKSNVVDVLKFMRDIVAEGLDHAISKRGGITTIRQHSRTKPFQISFKLCFSDNSFEDKKPRTASYEITISSLVAGNYRVEREEAIWFEEEYDFDEESSTGTLVAIHRRTMQRSMNGSVSIDGEKTKSTLLADQVALGLRLFSQGDEVAFPIARFVRAFRFLTLFPHDMCNPIKIDADIVLRESGDNWASVLKALKRTARGRQQLERIKEMMQVVMPTIKDIHVKTVGGYLAPQFRIANSKNASFDLYPSQLSEGTLRVLGILLALYQNQYPEFLAIEEPEQSIHPGLLSMLAEAFHEVSERTQLFVTSHSPHLIEFFAPEEIRVAVQEDGETRVTPIKSAQLEAIKERLISMQELMLAEGLQAEEA